MTLQNLSKTSPNPVLKNRKCLINNYTYETTRTLILKCMLENVGLFMLRGNCGREFILKISTNLISKYLSSIGHVVNRCTVSSRVRKLIYELKSMGYISEILDARRSKKGTVFLVKFTKQPEEALREVYLKLCQ